MIRSLSLNNTYPEIHLVSFVSFFLHLLLTPCIMSSWGTGTLLSLSLLYLCAVPGLQLSPMTIYASGLRGVTLHSIVIIAISSRVDGQGLEGSCLN